MDTEYFKGYLRPMLLHLKNHYGIPDDGLVGAEIGVKGGTHAGFILNNLPIKMLYLIDPYIKYVGLDVTYDLDMYFRDSQKLLGGCENVRFIRKLSHKSTYDVPNNLDFVYIDGNHLLPYIKMDIENYYDKVKKNGYLGGHDYSGYTEENQVQFAVDEYCEENNLKLYTEVGNDPYTIKRKGIKDWWIIK